MCTRPISEADVQRRPQPLDRLLFALEDFTLRELFYGDELESVWSVLIPCRLQEWRGCSSAKACAMPLKPDVER
jgi:hypothetical protein